jgi:hypothetical protein
VTGEFAWNKKIAPCFQNTSVLEKKDICLNDFSQGAWFVSRGKNKANGILLCLRGISFL